MPALVRTLGGLSLSLFLLGGTAIAQTHDQPFEITIPAGNLAEALEKLGDQSGLQIMYEPAVARGIRVAAVNGKITPGDALTRLLAQTGLEADRVNDKTVVLRRADAKQEPKPVKKEQAEPSAANRPAQESSEQLEEIIVTASKRKERLQDVPISISVVTADDIDRRGLVGAADYLRGTPGANQVEGAPSQTIVIRGTESNTTFQGFRGGETTGTYFGETPTMGVAGMAGANVDIKLVDIERVEVLRGPQGTAFGGTSMGGAVRTIPMVPKLNQFEGSLGAGYSATSGTGGENHSFQAVGNIPLVTDKLAIRALAYAFSDSGFYRNRAGSDPAFQTAIAIPFGAAAFATDEEEVGDYYVSGGRISALFQASDELRFTFAYLTQKNETDGVAVANSGTYEQTIFQVAPEHALRGQTAGGIDQSIDIGNVTMEYGLGWADLLATYSHIEGGTTYVRPWTSIGFNFPVSNYIETPHRAQVGEVRLATHLDGAWDFLLGLYAEKSEDDYLSDTIWFGNPARNIYGAQAGRDLEDFLERRHLKQQAAFGEASWEFLPSWTLTGGVRAFAYDRSGRIDESGPTAGGSPPPILGRIEDSGTTFRGNLSYQPSDNAHLYAGWSQGFRIGGPQRGLPAGACDRDGDGIADGTDVNIESTRTIGADEVDSYELGGKFALLDRRLTIDAAVFRMEWTGMPVSRTISSPNPGCGGGFSVNAGTALSEGIELQANWQATDSLRVDLGGSYIHARLTEDVPAQRFVAGDRLPGAPKVNGSLGLQQDFAIGSHAAFVRTDAIYIGSFFGDVLQSPVTESGDYVKIDATARVAIDKLNIDLYVRNLTNEDAFTFRGSYNFAGLGDAYGYRLRPRTIGLQLSYRVE